MLEREHIVALPNITSAYSNAEAICPNLIIVSRGIDVVYKKSHSAGDRYEEKCFVEIMKKNHTLIDVGPHMLDEALGRCKLSEEARPDTLLLSKNFKLIEMTEFKSGRSNGIHRKIEGFSSLLDKLRSDSYPLSSLLNGVLVKNGILDYDFPRIQIQNNS